MRRREVEAEAKGKRRGRKGEERKRGSPSKGELLPEKCPMLFN